MLAASIRRVGGSITAEGDYQIYVGGAAPSPGSTVQKVNYGRRDSDEPLVISLLTSVAPGDVIELRGTTSALGIVTVRVTGYVLSAVEVA